MGTSVYFKRPFRELVSAFYHLAAILEIQKLVTESSLISRKKVMTLDPRRDLELRRRPWSSIA
jgi:hypothetical protein